MTSLIFLLCLATNPGEADFLKAGDSLWVGYGMAQGYGLPFGKKLTIKKVRVLFMKEARLVIEGLGRMYLRTDFDDSYAFRQDPYRKYDFTPEQWETIRQGRVTEGMSKMLFRCIKPLAEEIHHQTDESGPIEQWIYRAEPISLMGAGAGNPPIAIYYFRGDRLVRILGG